MLLGLRSLVVVSALVTGAVVCGKAFVAAQRLSLASTAKAEAGVLKPKRAVHRFATQELRLVEPSAHRTRLLLDERTVAVLREHARTRSPSFRVLQARCDEQAARALPSGYQAFNWADALASLSLCFHATGKQDYADAAIRYLTALLDDRFRMGDGQGGPAVVAHDSGYGIRTFGAYSALGYDWLRGAKGMTPGLRSKVRSRLKSFLDWYETRGYLRNEPIANYFWGYLTTLAFAGLATAGDHAEGQKWLDRARGLLGREVLPAFEADLRGGAWPEGFQYGEYVTLEVALVARAFETATGVTLADYLPWLSQTVDYHVHALLPGGKSVYGGGTWQKRPSEPSALGLTGVMAALEGRNPEKAAEARWLVYKDLPPLARDGAWVSVLGTRPGARAIDPRHLEPTSYHAPGTGLSFVRSDWSDGAVWASFQAGPFLTPDHQHKDQGHFEIWRGSDGLLVDFGGTEGSATLNHNTLLVDDGGRNLTYAPNQGVWGAGVRTTHFEDSGRIVLVRGELAEAYAPACAPKGCTERSVRGLTRTFVYVRPSLFVVDDRVRLEEGGDGVKWIVHTTARPTVVERRMTASVGGSRVEVQSVLPRGGAVSVLKEPAGSGRGPHRTNEPFGTVFRLEVDSPRGARDRRFLHWIHVADAGDPRAERAVAIEGTNVHGAVGAVPGGPLAVLFAGQSGEGAVTLPPSTRKVVIAGLEPGARYALTVGETGACSLSFRPDDRGRPVAKGGFLEIEGCAAAAARENQNEAARIERSSH